MKLRGQQGYAMVALMVGLSIMAVLMSVAMPTWRQAAQRDKEAELIFRGEQYARAIGLFQRKSGPGVLPPNLDVLVDGHFLRKKYKDPITGQDFEVMVAGGVTPPGAAPGAGQTPATQTNQPGGGQASRFTMPSVNIGASGRGAGAPSGGRGGIMGVASKSKEQSIRIYNGRTHYNEWQFVYVAQTQTPGQGAPGVQPQRGGPGQGQGGVPGIGGVGRGRDDGRGRSGQGNPPFGRDAQSPFNRGPSTGSPPPSPRR